MQRLVKNGLLVSALTLLLLPGCNSESPPNAKNQPESDSTGSIDNSSPNNPDSKTEQANSGSTKSDEVKKGEAHGKLPPFETFELLASMEAEFSSVDAIAFAPDGKTLVTCGDTPKIWEIGATEPLYEFGDIYPLTGTVVEPEAVAISSDGKLLAFAGGDGIIYMFDYVSREAKHEIKASEAGVVSLSFSNDRKKLASSSYDGKARVWNTETGELIATCDAQKDRRVRSSMAPDGSYLVTAGEEAEVWDTSTGEKKVRLAIGEPRQIGVWFVDVSTDGKKIVTGDATRDFENAAMVWSGDSGKLEATLKHEYGVGLVAFSPNGLWLATGDSNGVARIWQLANHQLVQTIENEEVFGIDAIQWTPDSKVLAISNEGTIQFWGPPGAWSQVETVQGNETENDMPGDPETIPGSGVDGAEEIQPDSVETTPKQPVISSSAGPIVKFDEVSPISVSDAARKFSASDFPAPFEAIPGQYAGSSSAGYMIRKPYDDVLAELDKNFDELKWEVLALENSTEKNIAYYLRKKQLLLACKVREEQESVVRVDMTILGNVDIRSIPKLDPKEVSFDLLDYSFYETNSSLDDIMSHYEKLLTAAGWQKYAGFDSSNEDSPDMRMSKYRNGGVSLNVSASQLEGEKYASLFCEMLEEDVPTPSAVSQYELDDQLFRQRFLSTQSVDELTSFFVDEMKRSNWNLTHGKSFNGTQTGILFTRPDHDPVYLELWQRGDGKTEAYMAGPTRQASRAAKGEFEVKYQDGLPLAQTQFHSIDYRTIPFNNPLDEGSGRTIAESVFFNTSDSLEDNFEFYRDYFSKLGWEAGARKNELIGDKLQSASIIFKNGDASIVVTAGLWIENANRVTIEGNGISFPGSRFCNMMARPEEAMEIE